MTQGTIWSSFRIDPRLHIRLRASDEDRDIVRECIGDAFADGRLDRREFDERLTAVGDARLLGDLLEPLTDLVMDAHPIAPSTEPDNSSSGRKPGATPSREPTADTGYAPTPAHLPGGDPLNPPPPSTSEEIEVAARSHHAKALRASLSSFAGASAITTLIWLAMGLFNGGFNGFWPMFVMLGTGIGVISTASRRSQIIDERRQKLTRQALEYKQLEGPQRYTGALGPATPPASQNEETPDGGSTDNSAPEAAPSDDQPPEDPPTER